MENLKKVLKDKREELMTKGIHLEYDEEARTSRLSIIIPLDIGNSDLGRLLNILETAIPEEKEHGEVETISKVPMEVAISRNAPKIYSLSVRTREIMTPSVVRILENPELDRNLKLITEIKELLISEKERQRLRGRK